MKTFENLIYSSCEQVHNCMHYMKAFCFYIFLLCYFDTTLNIVAEELSFCLHFLSNNISDKIDFICNWIIQWKQFLSWFGRLQQNIYVNNDKLNEGSNYSYFTNSQNSNKNSDIFCSLFIRLIKSLFLFAIRNLYQNLKTYTYLLSNHL